MMNISTSTVVSDAFPQTLFADFLRVADEFAAMQQEHKEDLLAGRCKELFAWQQHREKAFRALAHMLERMDVCGGADNEQLAQIRASMGELLLEEDVLQKLIVAWKMKVQRQLHAMRKGKEALHGYNINKGPVPRPRYLSSKM